MSHDSVSVAVLGLGPIGLDAACRVAREPGLDLVGVADSAAGLTGRTLGSLCSGCPDMIVAPSLDELLLSTPDVVIFCTGSRIEQLAGDFQRVLGAGISIVTSAEELACPRRTAPELAARLDSTARSNGARLVGTGVNPGFVLDALPAFLAGATNGVRHVHAQRLVDSNKRRAGLRQKTGCGLTREAFDARAGEASIGHVGLVASAHLLATGLGLLLEVEETLEPVLSHATVQTPEGPIEPGLVLGARQLAIGRTDSHEHLRLELTIAAGTDNPRDTISIDADPPLSLRIDGGIAGDGASAARVVSAVRGLLRTAPGLRTVLDLPAASPVAPAS